MTLTEAAMLTVEVTALETSYHCSSTSRTVDRTNVRTLVYTETRMYARLEPPQ